MLIGIYDYTVILTYFSLLSAGTGIVVSLSGSGHPYLGVFFLLICGLCDAFDGKVAGTKKNRTDLERNFGIQIDSLSDIVAFGVLPACIGASLMRLSPFLNEISEPNKENPFASLISFVLFGALIFYILAALIRLAYFNVTEEERQKVETGSRKTYTGLPVTAASLIFPAVMLLQYVIPADLTLLYFAAVLFTGFAFLANFQIRKPGLRGILIMVGIGLVEFVLMLIFRLVLKH